MKIILIAANFGYIDIVVYLVSNNANINKKAFNGLSPLHMGF